MLSKEELNDLIQDLNQIQDEGGFYREDAIELLKVLELRKISNKLDDITIQINNLRG